MKDIELLKYKLEGLQEINMRMREICEPNSEEQHHLNGSLVVIEKVLEIIDDIGGSEVTLNRAFEKISEVYPMTKEEVCRHLEHVVAHGGKVTYGESEVLSHEWIERNTSPVDDEGRLYIWKRDLENLIVPKQELPVVPTWFDKWWKNIIKGERNLFHNIKLFHDELYNYGTEETYDYINDPVNKKKLLNIIVNELDYKVEEEPLYRVSAEDMRSGFWFLCKDNDGDIMIGTNADYYRDGWESLKLTEQEIKDYDERYWAFAKPVEGA